MSDDEMEMWRKQWQGQPSVVVDLIRRVERETVEMRMVWFPFFAPAAVGAVATVLVALHPSLWGFLFILGLWLFGAFTLVFVKWNFKGAWTPQAETTAAYLELSILRCRRKLRDDRVGRVIAVLLPAFVLVGVLGGVYDLLKDAGALKTAGDYWIVAGTFLWTSLLIIGIVVFILFNQRRIRTKTQAELEYLLTLQQQLLREEGENMFG